MGTFVSFIFKLRKDNADVLRADGKPRLFMSPPAYVRIPGFNPPDSVISTWEEYPGDVSNVSNDCGDADGGDAAPTWSTLNPPPLIPGKDYLWIVPFTAATAADGHSIADYDTLTKPPFLAATNDTQGRIVLSGSVPANLNLNQTYSYEFITHDNRGIPATYTNVFPIQSVLVEGAVQFQDAQDQAIVRISPNMDVAPKVSIKLPGGSSYSTPIPATKSSSPETVLGKLWQWYAIFTGLTQNGIHVVRIEALNQTLYGIFIVQGGNIEQLFTLTTNGPTADVYAIFGDTTIQKGQTKTYVLKKQNGAYNDDVDGETYELLNAITGVSIGTSSGALTTTSNANLTNGQAITILSKVAGVEKARLVVTASVDTPPPVIVLAQILAVDAYYIPPGSNPSGISRHFGVSFAENDLGLLVLMNKAGKVEYKILPVNADGTVRNPENNQMDWTEMGTLTNDSLGYQSGSENINYTGYLKLSFRPKDNPTAVVEFIYLMPTVKTDAKTIWPQGDTGVAVGVPATTQILKANPDIFNPVATWSNGAWHVTDTATPDVPAGYTKYYFISGATGSGGLPFNSFNPGEEVEIYMSISQTPNPHTSIFNRKAQCRITFGPAPN